MQSIQIASEAQTQYFTRPADQRFESLEALSAAVHDRRNRSKSTVVSDVAELEVAAKGNSIVVNHHVTPAVPTHWSFGQFIGRICKGMGQNPAAFLRTLPVSIAVDAINATIKKAKDGVKLLTIGENEKDADTLQAVTSEDYGRIWDAELVDAVKELVDATGGAFFNPPEWDRHPDGTRKKGGLYASDRDCFIFMINGGSIVDAGGERDQLHRGFMTWNSEVGKSSLGVATFLFRACCGNHSILGVEGESQTLLRHYKGAPDRFRKEVLPALMTFINADTKAEVEVIQKAKAFSVPTELDKLIEAGQKWGFSRSEIRDAKETAEREEGQCATLWDLHNGLTASARSYEHMDARVDLERRAGKLLQLVQ